MINGELTIEADTLLSHGKINLLWFMNFGLGMFISSIGEVEVSSELVEIYSSTKLG